MLGEGALGTETEGDDEGDGDDVETAGADGTEWFRAFCRFDGRRPRRCSPEAAVRVPSPAFPAGPEAGIRAV